MTGTIFVETLRRGWRMMLYWGIGMGLYSLVIAVAVLDDAALSQIGALMNSMPAFLIQGFMGTADVAFMTSPDGYFAVKFFAMALLIFSAYAVMAGMAVTANDEDEGVLDSFLSLPVHRWSIIVGRSLAYALLFAGALVLTYLGVVIGAQFVPQMPYDLGAIAVGVLNMYFSMLLVMAITVLCGVLLRRRTVALGVASTIIVVSYFLDFLASGAKDSALNTIGYLSFFHYYDGVGVMQYGLNSVNVVLVATVAVICAALALWRFQKRDIGL